jgi:hypothetical protein
MGAVRNIKMRQKYFKRNMILTLTIILDLNCTIKNVNHYHKSVLICSGNNFIRFKVDSIAVYINKNDSVILKNIAPLLYNGIIRGEWFDHSRKLGQNPIKPYYIKYKSAKLPSTCKQINCPDSLFFDKSDKHYYYIFSSTQSSQSLNQMDLRVLDEYSAMHFEVIIFDNKLQLKFRTYEI